MLSRSFKTCQAQTLISETTKLVEPSKNFVSWKDFQQVPVTNSQSCLSTALGVTAERLPDILYSQNQGEVWKGSYISLAHVGVRHGDTALPQPHEKPGAKQKYMQSLKA